VECCTPSSGCAIHHPLAHQSGSQQTHSFCTREREREREIKMQNIPQVTKNVSSMSFPTKFMARHKCHALYSTHPNCNRSYFQLKSGYDITVLSEIISMIIYERVMWCHPLPCSFTYLCILSFSAVMSMPLSFPLQ
jgi:hypothetical protein